MSCIRGNIVEEINENVTSKFDIVDKRVNHLFQTISRGEESAREAQKIDTPENQSNDAKRKECKTNEDLAKETYASKAGNTRKNMNTHKATQKDEPVDEKAPMNVAWIGDSHTIKLDKKVFENMTNTKVDVAIAYTVDKDVDAKYPERNFLKVVPEKVSK